MRLPGFSWEAFASLGQGLFKEGNAGFTLFVDFVLQSVLRSFLFPLQDYA